MWSSSRRSGRPYWITVLVTWGWRGSCGRGPEWGTDREAAPGAADRAGGGQVSAPVGLSFQRPDKRAVEQDAEAVRVWREETWPAIRARAKVEGRRGALRRPGRHPLRPGHRPHLGRQGVHAGRPPHGQPVLVNAMSAISTKGRMHFMVFTETFDADVMCRFLDRLVGHFDRKVHLVVDGHSAHRSRKVRAWLADHPDRIELHFLPSYSPELNPDELVNADLKRSLPMHSRARDQAQLAAEARRFFHRRQRQPHIVRGYFGGPQVRYTLEWNPLSFGSIVASGLGGVLSPRPLAHRAAQNT
ncbi:IS630 family transposase [Streptomyces viridochromogenes]|uniref:IS630 family transposase n=1 Tax=Streptomyces viridochromogenes TaxID=1938 RepID=UPI001F16A0DC|nr:IS630 family transposase [Streptomyces viridochromogenes]